MENQAKNTDIGNETKTNVTPLRPQNSPNEKKETSQANLQHLLMTTESSAQRIQTAIRKWQVLSLFLTMLVIPCVILLMWMSAESMAAKEKQGKLETENQTLKNQLNTANSQIGGTKNEVEILMNRNIELVQENAKLKSKNNPPAAQPIQSPQPEEQKIISNKTTTLDQGRMEKIRGGKYPGGTTRTELTSILGQPNRIYTSRGYEQFVYFDKKPGRFWFIGSYLVQTAN